MSETLTQLITYDDYRELPDDGNQYQIIGGELFMTAAPYSSHQLIARNIFRIIDQYVYKNELGETLFSPIDVVFSMTDVVQPDILFISKERMNILTEKNIVAAPELVVEVLSKSTKNIDRNLKKELYARHGVEEYWLADPKSSSISQFTLNKGILKLMKKADTENPIVNCQTLKGLTADIRPIFE